MSKWLTDVDMVCIATQSYVLYFFKDFRHNKHNKFTINFICSYSFLLIWAAIIGCLLKRTFIPKSCEFMT